MVSNYIVIEGYLINIVNWFFKYSFNIALSIIVFLIYVAFRKIINPKIEEYIDRDHLKSETLKSALFSISIFSGMIASALILFIWGFDFKVLFALSSGIIALTGVALFASWSILSNVTSFFILLVHSSFKRGNFIRVIDADNYVEGYISEISLFNTKLITVDREIILFPNNLLIARPIMINSKVKYNTIGKTDDFKVIK